MDLGAFAEPGALLAELHQEFAKYLALEETGHIDFALAVAISAELDGDPLWGMLVGVPSSSKTEVIRSLADRAILLNGTTVAGLLSWKSVRGKPPVPAGLLSRHQGRVFTTISDLSALLAMSDRGARDMLYAILRRVYDGQVTRDLRQLARHAPLAGPDDVPGRCHACHRRLRIPRGRARPALALLEAADEQRSHAAKDEQHGQAGPSRRGRAPRGRT